MAIVKYLLGQPLDPVRFASCERNTPRIGTRTNSIIRLTIEPGGDGNDIDLLAIVCFFCTTHALPLAGISPKEVIRFGQWERQKGLLVDSLCIDALWTRTFLSHSTQSASRFEVMVCIKDVASYSFVFISCFCALPCWEKIYSQIH